MKNLLVALLCVSALGLSAQPSQKELIKHQNKVKKSLEKGSVVHSLDTVFNAGQPFCLLVEEERMLGTMIRGSVKTLAGEEVIWVNYKSATEFPESNGKNVYELVFVASGKKSHYALALGTHFEEDLVKFGLFKEGVYQSGAEAKFIAAYPDLTGRSSKQENPGKGYTLVDRNRNAPLFVNGSAVLQDQKQIGTFKQSSVARDGTIEQKIQFYLPDGTLVAEAVAYGATSHDWTITTAKDNEVHSISSAIGRDVTDLAQFLVQRLYL